MDPGWYLLPNFTSLHQQNLGKNSAPPLDPILDPLLCEQNHGTRLELFLNVKKNVCVDTKRGWRIFQIWS